jgi:hypothetical protein
LPPAPLRVSAISPVGRVALVLDPLPDDYRSYSFTLSTHPIPGASEQSRGQRQGQEVGHAKPADSEERASGQTSCPEDTRPTLLPGHRPFLPAQWRRRASHTPLRRRCACCTGLTRYCFRSCLLSKDFEQIRRLLTRNPFPLESPGALGILRSLVPSFPFALLSTLRVGFSNAQTLCR